MNDAQKEQLFNYFEAMKDLNAEDIMKNVEKHLDDEAIEIFVDHIEDFYGVEDDEELGMLAQLMVSGFLAAKELSKIES
jgi:hypothetical protein